MKKVIYISVPMKGRERGNIERDIAGAKEFLTEEFGADYDLRFISPLEIGDRLDKLLDCLNELKACWKPALLMSCGELKAGYSDYMGFDISALIEWADTVYFCEGWRKSNGCRLEHEAAMYIWEGDYQSRAGGTCL